MRVHTEFSLKIYRNFPQQQNIFGAGFLSITPALTNTAEILQENKNTHYSLKIENKYKYILLVNRFFHKNHWAEIRANSKKFIRMIVRD